MKTLRYSLVTLIFSVFVINIFAQGNITIQGGGAVTVNGNTFIIPCPLTAPTAGTQVPSQTQIIWNWNPVQGATGYKWNTTNDYGTAADMGTATIKTETGLTCNTAYIRYAWAYSPCGNTTAVTMIQSTSACPWSCGQPITDSRNGKTYTTVQIGTQCWMAQNMNIGTRIPGTSNQANNSIIEKYCFNNDENMCNVYGGLYQWDEAMQYSTTPGIQGICPSGWHLPTDAEWTTLTTFLGGEAIAGGKMKEAGLSHWASPNYNATNSSGFTALPGGYNQGGFVNLTIDASFCSSSLFDASHPWVRYLFYGTEAVYSDYYGVSKAYGFSARCLQD